MTCDVRHYRLRFIHDNLLLDWLCIPLRSDTFQATNIVYTNIKICHCSIKFDVAWTVRDFTEPCSSYDHAVTEHFFLNLKMERVWRQYYAHHQEAIKDVSLYITVFYNQVSLHSTLNYLSPYQFEQNTNNLSIEVSDFS